MRKLVVLCLAVTLCLGMLMPTALAATATTVKLPISMQALNVRSGPGTNYDVVAWVQHGSPIELVSTGSVWSKIRVSANGRLGYIKNSYIADIPKGDDDHPATTGVATAGRVTGRSVNLRWGPSTSYGKAASLVSGTKLKIWGSRGNWHYVTTLSGKVGWISKTYVATGFSSTTTARVNLRQSPNGSLIRTLAKGAPVSVISMTGSWSKVKSGSSTGYVFTKYLK